MFLFYNIVLLGITSIKQIFQGQVCRLLLLVLWLAWNLNNNIVVVRAEVNISLLTLEL